MVTGDSGVVDRDGEESVSSLLRAEGAVTAGDQRHIESCAL